MVDVILLAIRFILLRFEKTFIEYLGFVLHHYIHKIDSNYIFADGIRVLNVSQLIALPPALGIS